MNIKIGHYIVDAHELDNKISLNITTDVKGEVKIKSINEFISFEDRVIYYIEGYNGEFYDKRASKIFGDYILFFEQKTNGELEIWYMKMHKENRAFVSRKIINGESLTIALQKEV